MAEKKLVPTYHKTPGKPAAKPTSLTAPLFEKQNYIWMAIGAVVVALGMLLMAGGKNTSASEFDYNVVYSTTRVTIAPILILLGLVIEIYAIFKRPSLQK